MPPSGSVSQSATAIAPTGSSASSSRAEATAAAPGAASIAAAARLTLGRPGSGACAGGARCAIWAASSVTLTPDSADSLASCCPASAAEQPSCSMSMPLARSTTQRAAASELTWSSSSRWRATSAFSLARSPSAPDPVTSPAFPWPCHSGAPAIRRHRCSAAWRDRIYRVATARPVPGFRGPGKPLKELR